MKVHERIVVPEPVTLAGETLQDVLLVARLTMPEKPLTAVTVMVDVAAVFALTVVLVGFAEIEKS